MRELYAAELIGDKDSSNRAAWPKIEAWADRHSPSLSSENLLSSDEENSGAVSVILEESSDGQRGLVIVQRDDGDTNLLWRSEIAVGAPDSPLHATVRIRLGTTEGSSLRPLEYEFGVPTIVRTLLRDFAVLDAGVRTESRYVEIGASNIPDLISWLMDSSRRLPVVVVSRTSASGERSLDARSLARELAGIAHVRILSASQASWALSESVGRDLGVWGGAVRVYFPGFSLQDDRYQHRLFLSERVGNSLITALRSWFGTLSASSTYEHPMYVQLRSDRHERLQAALANGDPGGVKDYIQLLEQTDSGQRVELDELKAQNSLLVSENRRLAGDNEALKDSFADVARATGMQQAAKQSIEPSGPLTVARAIDAAEGLARNLYYRDRVSVTDQAFAKGRRFSSYKRPDELLRAVHAVLEAGALHHDSRLGTTPMEFFARRGYGYGSQPSPHLKVDESTSPDQCLRIYWEDDTETRHWTITSIGQHL